MSGSPILLAIIGIAFLSGMDAAMKSVALAEPIVVATWLRYVFGGLFTLPLVFLLKRPMPDRTGLKVHMWRGLILTFTSLTFFYSLSILTLAETITIAFSAPLVVPFMAAVFLKEKLKPGAILAVAAGFLGVLISVQGEPGTTATDTERLFATASALTSAILYAAATLMLRARAPKDDGLAITALATVIPLVLLTPAALIFWPVPQVEVLPNAALAGLLGMFGVLALAAAYAKAEAQVLIVFEYTGLGWAALLGWLVFGETSDWPVFLGAAIIAGACLYIAFAERRAARIPVKRTNI
ncbi:MAG: DMT family transporter [Pacificimonas sp.]